VSDELLELAVTAARAAAGLLRARFAGPRTGVATKSSGTDMVSDADRAAERLILSMIGDARPSDGVLGEESGERAGTSGVRWIVDPLDGTTNFLYGVPHFAVSIAAEDERGTLAGVVFDVMRDEMFAAARGNGATLAPGGGAASSGATPNAAAPGGARARVAVSAQGDLARALVATGFSYDASERETQARVQDHVLPRVRDARRFGSAALDFAWTACGRFDGYFEAPCYPWDAAAGELLVREAGGRTAPMEAVGPSGPGWIAANPALFDALAELVAEAVARSRAQAE
jgi:myo-inositol-1(or 4)-monophosphatase